MNNYTSCTISKENELFPIDKLSLYRLKEYLNKNKIMIGGITKLRFKLISQLFPKLLRRDVFKVLVKFENKLTSKCNYR